MCWPDSILPKSALRWCSGFSVLLAASGSLCMVWLLPAVIEAVFGARLCYAVPGTLGAVRLYPVENWLHRAAVASFLVALVAASFSVQLCVFRAGRRAVLIQSRWRTFLPSLDSSVQQQVRLCNRAVRLIKIESQSRFETLRFANRKACDVDAILLCSRAYAWLPALSGRSY